MGRPLPVLLAAAALALVPAAGAQAGPSGGMPAGGAEPASNDGGARPGDPVTVPAEPKTAKPAPKNKKSRPARKRSKRRSRLRGRPILASYEVRPGRFFIYGPPARVVFQINDRSRTVRARISVYRRGGRTPVQTIPLGNVPTRRVQTVQVNGRSGGVLPQGDLELRISARDPGGKLLRRGAGTSRVGRLAFYWHRHPLLGSFSYGNEGSRFGAPRSGHTHRGQDLSAPEGTPVIAPRGGVVKTIAYQRGGAGNYIVLDGAGENRNYVFMHLATGTNRVREGQRVRTGQRLADVGNTGSSSGPHLHFEIWVGPWFGGGEPVDPLPLLKRWGRWS